MSTKTRAAKAEARNNGGQATGPVLTPKECKAWWAQHEAFSSLLYAERDLQDSLNRSPRTTAEDWDRYFSGAKERAVKHFNARGLKFPPAPGWYR